MAISTNPYGNTQLQVSRIGLGLAALGRPGYINIGHAEDLANNYVIDAMEGRTHRMLDLAYERGVRYFDAARSYGKAEAFLASWLKDKDLPDLVIGSKWGYIYTAEWKIEAEKHEVKHHTIEVLEKQWEQSAILQPHLKLYQIHSATFESGVLDNKDVLNKLAKIKASGTKVGLSLSGTKQAEVLEEAMLIRVDGVHLFDSVQATYNVLEQSAAPALKQAAEAGMGVTIKEALANGRLTPRNRKAEFAPIKEALESVMDHYQISMDMLCLAFVLSRPWAHIVLSGAAVETHLKSNLAADKVQLEAGAVEALETLAQEVNTYWEERKGLTWN